MRKGEVVLAVLGPSVQWAGFDHGVLVSCVLFPQHRLVGEVFDVNLQVQCPTRQDPPHGCIEPGKRCKFGNKRGICVLAKDGVNCTCDPISDPDA